MDCHIPSVYPLSTYQYILSISIHPLNINTPSQHILIHPLKTYPNTLSIFLLNIQPLKTTSNRQPRPLTTPLWFTHPPAHSPTHPLTHPLTHTEKRITWNYIKTTLAHILEKVRLRHPLISTNTHLLSYTISCSLVYVPSLIHPRTHHIITHTRTLSPSHLPTLSHIFSYTC